MKFSCFLLLGNDKDDLVLSRTIYNLKGDLNKSGCAIGAKDIGRHEDEVSAIMEKNDIDDLPALLVINEEEGNTDSPYVYEGITEISKFFKSIMQSNEKETMRQQKVSALNMSHEDVFEDFMNEVAQNPHEIINDEPESNDKKMQASLDKTQSSRKVHEEGVKSYSEQRAPAQKSHAMPDDFANINMDEYIAENQNYFANATPKKTK